MVKFPDVPYLHYNKINNHAEKFLNDLELHDTLPVPIEEIVEFNLGINIVPFPNLQTNFDVEGFLSIDLTNIYVDEFIYNNRPTRFRFTLAHEVGHFILHRRFIKKFAFSSIDVWKDFYRKADDKKYSWLEWQAYAFAGLLLVPRKILLGHFPYQLKKLKDEIELSKSKGIPRETYKEHVIDSISTKLTRIYNVSNAVLIKRISKEVELGMLTIP